MKIGIIGGTFDPLHVSHINIASEAKKQFDLEQIWFMLSPNPPHKNSETVNSFEVRFEMLNIGLRDNCSFIILYLVITNIRMATDIRLIH